jgi:hypothetical protein
MTTQPRRVPCAITPYNNAQYFQPQRAYRSMPQCHGWLLQVAEHRDMGPSALPIPEAPSLASTMFPRFTPPRSPLAMGEEATGSEITPFRSEGPGWVDGAAFRASSSGQAVAGSLPPTGLGCFGGSRGNSGLRAGRPASPVWRAESGGLLGEVGIFGKPVGEHPPEWVTSDVTKLLVAGWREDQPLLADSFATAGRAGGLSDEHIEFLATERAASVCGGGKPMPPGSISNDVAVGIVNYIIVRPHICPSMQSILLLLNPNTCCY